METSFEEIGSSHMDLSVSVLLECMKSMEQELRKRYAACERNIFVDVASLAMKHLEVVMNELKKYEIKLYKETFGPYLVR